MRNFNVYLRSVLVLTGLLLLSSCEADLKVTTNANEIDCAVLTEDTYCIKVRNGQINSVKDLALVQDQILTSASDFNLSWKMPETAKGILATKVVLASDTACTQVVKSAEVEVREQSYSFTNIKDGIYYACVFARARAAGLLGAKNNGIKILVEVAAPQIESASEVFYTNGSVMSQSPNIKSIGLARSEWTQISGPGKLTFSKIESTGPTVTASADGSYTFSITAINEVGIKSTKSFTLVFDSTPPVLKEIAPIISSADSVAIKVESLEELKAYRWEILSTPGGVSPMLKDADSATAELSLPSLGTYQLRVSGTDQAGNVSSIKVWIVKQAPAGPPVDTTNPLAPAAITVATYSSTTSVSASYTAGSDANFSTHNVKACAASDCSTACLGVSQDITSPVTVNSLVNGNAYYICMQAVDLSGNVSDYVASGNSVTVDTTAPTAPSSLGFSSSYSSSTTLSLGFAVGTDPNFGAHDARLCTASDCITGCGSTIQSASSPVSLSGTAGATYYGCARSRDLAGNTSSWIASIGTMTIDNSNPTPPSAITIPAFTNSNSVTATYSAGSDFNLATHNVKACTASNCSTGCLSVSQNLSSPVTVSSLVPGTSYWICLQTVDQASNVSAYVASGNSVTIDTTSPTAPSGISFASSYTGSTTAALTWSHGTDTNFSTHNLKACTDAACSVGCIAGAGDNASPGSIAGLADGTTYYACVQSEDSAGNTSAWAASAGTSKIDTTNPGLPTAVTFSNTFQLAFTPGTEINPSSFNLKACTDAGCSAGCVGDTSTAGSPGQISAAALTVGTAYYGCVQATDLATNTSAFVASGATSTRYPYSVSYQDNGSSGGTVPEDIRTYDTGHTVTVLGNTGSLVKAGYNFHSWNTQANGSGSRYTAGQSLVMGSAHVTLYAQWIVDCSGLVGGSWVAVPGSAIYGTESFCVMKYPASNISSVATSQPGSNPWVSINQVDARSACTALGTGFHLPKNPEWMTIASDIANTGSNWSGGTVGSGTLRRGHSDNSPSSLCGADASDANAYVEGSCTGSSTGTFLQRRTSSFSNGQVIWDIGGNVWSWVDYNSPWDKAYSGGGWVEFPALSYSATMPRTVIVPVNSAQPWWSDSWNSSQGVGQYIESGTNGAGGALIRGNSWFAQQYAGAFSFHVWSDQGVTANDIGFRCAYTPFRLTYNGNGHSSGTVPTDNNKIYSAGDSTTAAANSGNLARVGYTFAGWNTAYNGTGTNYAPGATLNFTAGSITLYAKWTLDCSGLAGGTWVVAPGNSVYGTRDFCVMKYAATNVGSVASSGTSNPPWVNISQTDAITSCSNLGANYHLISNPEWMTIGANIANNGSNWSGGSVGNGTLSSGHSDNSPASNCAADAADANAYVEGSCTGSSTGTFNQRRTGLLSNGAVIWDFGGNVWNWVNYSNLSDKPTPADMSWYEFNSLTFATKMPRAQLLPVNSAQNWWSDSWNSTQRIGQYIGGSNGGGGALRRGGGHDYDTLSGPFTAGLLAWPSYSEGNIGFRCAYQPAPARSCLDHLNDGASTSGIYSIDPDGTGPIAAFSTYCDMTTDGGGWTLMASSFPPNAGLNKVSTLTSPTADGILVEDKLVAIANVATTVRIKGEGKTVISFDSWPIGRLRTMQMLVDPSNGWGWAHFSGNNDPELFHYSWSPGDQWRFNGLNLHNTIFNASYNGDGLHWNTSFAKWRWNDANAVYNLNLWVK